MTSPKTERDSLDFRDLIYRPTLAAPPVSLWPKRRALMIRDQGEEGACTGFGLAAVIDYVGGLSGKRRVSARMLYEMARRYDRWPGIAHEGSTARATMKGWHKNGVCAESDWPYVLSEAGHLTEQRAEAALARPLGAYYRILSRRSDVHAALLETGAIFCSAAVHSGWDSPQRGRIRFDAESGSEPDSGHAFAIVGYTQEGFIIQNSWGPAWGGLTHRKERYRGLALWSYADFDANVWDLWVARHALPVENRKALAVGWLREGNAGTELSQKAPAQYEIRDHYIHIDDGRFANEGDYPSSVATVRDVVRSALQGQTGTRPLHVVLYAHGGLNDVKTAARRVHAMRDVFEANRIRVLHWIWDTGFLEEVGDVLLGRRSEAEKRAGGFGDWWDRFLEVATGWAGRALWREMRDDARLAFDEGMAGSVVLDELDKGLARVPAKIRPRLHLVGHSAGSNLLAQLLTRAAAFDQLRFGEVVLYAPACTIDVFAAQLRPALIDGRAQRLTLFRLDDRREQDDDVGGIYRKSLLYLVSRAYQEKGRVVPLLGLARDAGVLPRDGLGDSLREFDPERHPDLTRAQTHGAFDNDPATMNTTLRSILGAEPRRLFTEADLKF